MSPRAPWRRKARPPNILLLMTDQQRWDALGCSGGWVETPNLDGLATDGVRFAEAYTNSPVCVPARVSLVTGRYPHATGVRRNRSYTLPAKSATWMRAIREAGYATSVFGKTHLHPQRGDLRDRAGLLAALGLDHADEIAGPRASMRSRSGLTDLWQEAGVWRAYRRDLQDRFAGKPWIARPSPLPLELYPDVYVGRQAARYLRGYDRPEPWFCWVSFSGPHEPWDAPEPYASRYDPDAMPPPLRSHDDGHPRPRGLLDDRLAKGGVAFEPGDVARLRANYAGNVTLIDDQVGELLRVLGERGELDTTVIAFVSDHGEMNGDHGLLYKQTFLDPAVRVPFLIRPASTPGGARGAVAPGIVELMDIGATLVELAGGRQPPGSHARSVVPLLADPRRPHRAAALSELRRERMLVRPDWKTALNAEGHVYLLYQREEDREETRNLAGLPRYSEVERELRIQIRRLVRSTR